MCDFQSSQKSLKDPKDATYSIFLGIWHKIGGDRMPHCKYVNIMDQSQAREMTSARGVVKSRQKCKQSQSDEKCDRKL